MKLLIKYFTLYALVIAILLTTSYFSYIRNQNEYNQIGNTISTTVSKGDN